MTSQTPAVMTDISQFGMPTRIHFGIGARARIPEILAGHGLLRVLFICDPGLLDTAIFAEITHSLSDIDVAVFHGVDPEPKDTNVTEAMSVSTALGAEAIIVLGGGSAIDVAKAVAILSTNGGAISDYERDGTITIPPLPIIAVPTTAGTGSEVSGAAVITDTVRNVKMAIRHPIHGPAAHAILDPMAISTTPRHVAVQSGIDAFTHALESYVSKRANPFSDAINLHAMHLVAGNLRSYVNDPHNETVALNMLCASSMAAMSFGTTGTGNVHCMAMSLGSFHPLPHGLLISLLLPHVVSFNLSAAPDRFAAVARAMGEPIDGLSPSDAAARALSAINRLCADLGLPEGLAAAGVTDAFLEPAADRCFALDYNRWNPRYSTRNDFLRLFEQAM